MNFVETFGKTKEEAVEKAAKQLNVSVDQLSVEVLEEGNKGFLGLIGAKDFRIKATIKESVEEDFSPKDILSGIGQQNPKKTDRIKEATGSSDKAQNEKTVKMEEKVKKEEKIKSEETKITVSDSELEKSVNGFLHSIFDTLAIDASVAIRREGEIVKVKVEGESAGILIGRRGESLDALQLLLGLAVNKTAEGYVKLQLDIENYREKREESLVRYAHKMARMASKQRRNIKLEPMNPNERRIIHSALQSDSYVTTYSEGDEPYRKVVIAVRGRQQ